MKWALTLMAMLLPLSAVAQTYPQAAAPQSYPEAEAPKVIPQTVHFLSLDGRTQLVGYLFMPRAAPQGRIPAVVMLHGRAGPYSSAAQGRYDATTLSRRHQAWGEYWAEQGYAALLVDSFAPRGYPAGFQAHSYQDRPDAVNEVTVRPLDAYGALIYLRSRADIDGRRIALQGWSNGGSATLASLSADIFMTPQIHNAGFAPQSGFLVGIAFYPACGLHDKFVNGYRPYAPLRLLSGDADKEVSAQRCEALVQASAATGGDIAIQIYPGATHGFDDPNWKRQKVDANATATQDAVPRVTKLLREMFASVGHTQASGPMAAPTQPRRGAPGYYGNR